LDRDPETRIGSTADDSYAIRNHSFFHDMDWQALVEQRIVAPYIPEIRTDTD
jgi:hypothetical protein